MNFKENLLVWYCNNKRDLPWRNTDNPYFIWLSEIILQQTRVDQGMDYYKKFILKFPEINLLAEANEDEILKLWQGLGYYSRARNLHFASKQIIKDYNGKFPDNYDDILKLKGIGPYSAAAIASIAFNLPYPVIDGNVLRFISRLFGINTPVDSSLGKKEINNILIDIINKENPGMFNQAIMEMGAMVCKPKNPNCENCVFNKECYAYKNNCINLFPVKEKVIKQSLRYLYYIVIKLSKENKTYTYINKRNENDIWKGLYDFPLIESKVELSLVDNTILNSINLFFNSTNYIIKSISKQYKHKLSHQTIYAYFIELSINSIEQYEILNNNICVNIDDINLYPVPKLIENYLKEKNKSRFI